MASVQYIVIRKDIADRLGAGFAAAQISHASLAPVTGKFDDFSKPLSELVDPDVQNAIDSSIWSTMSSSLVPGREVYQKKPT